MKSCASIPLARVRGKWFFLGTFAFSCFLFWWLPSVLFRMAVHLPDAVENETIWISLIALTLWVAGYLLPIPAVRPGETSEPLFDACREFAYNAACLIFLPALIIAVVLLYSHSAVAYGSADPIPRPFQAVLYTHLFFGFMYLGAADPLKQGWRRVLTVVVLVTLPRLIESLHGGRFFLAQAVVPAVLIAVARGWIRFSMKRLLQFAAMALIIIFVPPLTRGDQVIGQDESVQFFAAGSTLKLFQDNTDLDLTGRCQPLLVSMTAKTIPYDLLGVCVLDFAGLKNMPATAGRIITVNEPGTLNGTVAGSGSNYLIELYLFGGLTAVFAGSALFGFSCRRFVGWIGKCRVPHSRPAFASRRNGLRVRTNSIFGPYDMCGCAHRLGRTTAEV